MQEISQIANKYTNKNMKGEEMKGEDRQIISLEVYLEYPKELHDSHDDYPLAVEKIHVSQNMLSSCCERIKQKYNISIG